MRMLFRSTSGQLFAFVIGIHVVNTTAAAAEDSGIGAFIALGCSLRIPNDLPDYQKLYDNCVKIEVDKYLRNRKQSEEAIRRRYGDNPQTTPQQPQNVAQPPTKEQQWRAEVAKKQIADAASNRAWLQENYGDNTGERLCKPGQAMHVHWRGPGVPNQDRGVARAFPADATDYLDSRGKLVPSGTDVQIVGPGLPKTGGLPPFCRVRISGRGELVMINVQDIVPEDARFKQAGTAGR
jgi:hypothetical protein